MTRSRSYRAVALAALVAISLIGVAAVPAAASHDDGDCEFPLTVTDDTGTEVTLEESAETVVAIDAASSQTLWEIGAADAVIGMPVRPYTDYLEGSEERTDVLTEDGSPDVETIVELDADLVIAPNFVDDDVIEQLRDADQTVYRLPFEESFEAIYEKTELYGHFVGECEAAEAVATETREEVEEIRDAVADRNTPRVLYYFFGFTPGDETFQHDIIEAAGGTNVAAEAGISFYEEISDEVILEEDPEWIVHPDTDGAFDAEEEPFPSTTAVQEGQVLVVDDNLVSQAAPRVVEPLREMAETFHPEAFEEETPTPEPTPTPEYETETPTSEPESDPEDQAGFGAAVAAIAALATALLARRR